MSAIASSSPAPADQAADDKIPLLDVLHDLGSVLGGSDLPIHAQLPQVVGAIVKVLDHAGVTVADELYPPEPVAVARPETVDTIHRAQTNQRLNRVEALLEELLGHIRPAAPAPADEGPAA